MKPVYLDHNSTTPLRREARERWLEVHEEELGNASSLHAAGRRARHVIDTAREQVARALGLPENGILFTSGGTEANNLALSGILDGRRGASLATTAAEHSSVLGPARALSERGVELALVPVDSTGMPDLAALDAAARRPRCALVSVMAANNEVGSVPPLEEVGRIVRDAAGPLLHTDAVQALGRIPLALEAAGVDLASFSAHKLGGPPGVGVLWLRDGVPLRPLLHGGEQERGLRPGTEDAAGIAAAALAIELAVRELEEVRARTAELARATWRELAAALPGLRLIGPPIDSTERLHNTLCIAVPETDGKVLVSRLDLEGLRASAGSACASGSIEPSHVLLAMGLDEDAARSGLRLSLGRSTTRAECKRAVEILRKVLGPPRATATRPLGC